MIPMNVWEHQNAIKALYSKCVAEICQKHDITRMELDILLFLANNPRYDTAKDMIEIRYLSKSQVSASIKLLEEAGYIQKKYTENNRKTAHLVICEVASRIIEDGRQAQEKFFSIMTRGIPEEELACLKRCMDGMWNNIDQYLKEEDRV